MSKPKVILVCGLALLAGCTTTPRTATERLEDWQVAPTEEPPPPPPVMVAPPVAPMVPGLAQAPEAKWLSLNRWREQQGVSQMRRMGAKPMESFALPTSNGVLVVTVGSRSAYWDRTEIRLGFAPQLIGNQIYVHALDVHKNFEPLLRPLESLVRTNRVIVIDPGHGGSNVGARNVRDGRREKEFTLDWARRLAPLLEEAGWHVFLTRANDMEVSLANRVAFAARKNADLFLSLHFNSLEGSGSEPAGLETYCLTPAGMPSTITRGYSDDASEVFPNNSYDEQNLQYAVRLHRALLAVNGGMDRGIRRARFPDVLRGQRCPAVLIEGGYLSNPQEAHRIADPAYRQRIAEAIAAALK